MSIDPRQFPVGQCIGNTTWVKRDVLGVGGMGVVLDVEKELPGVPRVRAPGQEPAPAIRGAMKLMLPKLAERADLMALFMNEIWMTTALRHRHIIAVIDAGVLPGGMPFVVTERLDGTNLRKLLRKVRGPLGANLAHLINTQLCDGIHRAHTNSPSIVHRDLKPENVFLHRPTHEPPMVKVLDWGVAALLDGLHDSSGYVGTPMYMAPEQVRGEPVTPMADIYAAAMMLYEMLTGRLPFDIDYTSQAHVEEAHRSLAPIPPSRFAPWMPKRVEAHLLRGLAKNPADRPRSAYAFAVEFYELQFVDDGKRPPSIGDVNATAPDLATLISEAKGEGDGGGAITDRHFTPPEERGRDLELANPSEEPPPAPLRPATLADQTQRPSFAVSTEKTGAPAAFGNPSAFTKGGTFRMQTAGAPPPPWAFGPPPQAPADPTAVRAVSAPPAPPLQQPEPQASAPAPLAPVWDRPGGLPAFPVRPAAGVPAPARSPSFVSPPPPSVEAQFFAAREPVSTVSSDAATSQSLPSQEPAFPRASGKGSLARSIALVVIGAAVGTAAVSAVLFVSRSDPAREATRPQEPAPAASIAPAPGAASVPSSAAAVAPAVSVAPIGPPTSPSAVGAPQLPPTPTPGPPLPSPRVAARPAPPSTAASSGRGAPPPKPRSSAPDDDRDLLYKSL